MDRSDPWGRWYETHRPALRRYLTRSLGSDRELADDILQDVYLRALTAGNAPPGEEDPKSWLFRIATNLVIDHYRRTGRRREERSPVSEAPDPSRGPEEEVIREDLRSRLRGAVARLPETQRQVFLLREYGDVPFREIALRTGAPLGTVLARMRYALLRLRAEIEKPGANGSAGSRGPAARNRSGGDDSSAARTEHRRPRET